MMNNLTQTLSSITDFYKKKEFITAENPYIVIKSQEQPNNNDWVNLTTAYYEPEEYKITIFTYGRHIRDIINSYCHELIHWKQDLEGRIKNIQGQNIHEDESLFELEKEAYEQGGLLLRSYKDYLKNNKLNENIIPQEKFAKETKKDWVKESLGNLPKKYKEEYDLNSYKIKILPTKDIIPTQFDEDYKNASSEYQAEVYEKYIKGELTIKDLRKEDFYPIIVDSETLEILDGNHRHAVHTMLNISKIKCIILTKKDILQESIINIIKEGKYDSITNQISSSLFNYFKEAYDNNATEPYTYFGDFENKHIQISVEGTFILDKNIENIIFDGGYYSEDDTIAVEVIVNPNTLPQNWEEISMGIKDIVRHEIEHSTHNLDSINLKNNKGKENDETLRKIIDVTGEIKKYFLLPKEIEANIQGLYFRAKKEKKPLIQLIHKYLEDQGLDKDDIDDIIKVWRSYSNKLNIKI